MVDLMISDIPAAGEFGPQLAEDRIPGSGNDRPGASYQGGNLRVVNSRSTLRTREAGKGQPGTGRKHGRNIDRPARIQREEVAGLKSEKAI